MLPSITVTLSPSQYALLPVHPRLLFSPRPKPRLPSDEGGRVSPGRAPGGPEDAAPVECAEGGGER